MNVVIPPKLRNKTTSFGKLVVYISERDNRPKAKDIVTDSPKSARSEARQSVFDRLVEYIDRSDLDVPHIQVLEEFSDGRQRAMVGDVPCETNCFSWETSAAEMNMVASQNRRCVDPVYHFILSWQEHEAPTNQQVFDSAKHCIDALGMQGHQYVTAIHFDTDNVHCHVAVNRVHPETFKAANMWNDADELQKCCRVLERKYGFAQDNGSWEWADNNALVPAPFRFPSAPQGAAKTQIFSDQESLFHYSVRTSRDELDQIIGKNLSNWETVHLQLHMNGLALREEGSGLVVCDALRPDTIAVKASSVHPSLTKARLEQHWGRFEPAPSYTSADPFEPQYGVFETYQPAHQLRDKDARAERREERAAAREALKARYQTYRSGWQKPDLNIPARQQEIALRYRSMKQNVRRRIHDAQLRKLLYRVAEFERMKAMAHLRIQLKDERNKLADTGANRPLSYRVWVELEALNGDQAAVSQLRGWAYREKRKDRAAERHTDGVIRFAAADDTAVLDRRSHATQLRRDGTIEYLRYGRVGVVDHGDQVEIRSDFEDLDQQANYRMAVGLASTKSGEHVEIVGKPEFVDRVLEAGVQFNAQYSSSTFVVTDAEQQARYAYLENFNDQSISMGDAARTQDGQPSADHGYDDDDEPPVLNPGV